MGNIDWAHADSLDGWDCRNGGHVKLQMDSAKCPSCGSSKLFALASSYESWGQISLGIACADCGSKGSERWFQQDEISHCGKVSRSLIEFIVRLLYDDWCKDSALGNGHLQDSALGMIWEELRKHG